MKVEPERPSSPAGEASNRMTVKRLGGTVASKEVITKVDCCARLAGTLAATVRLRAISGYPWRQG